MIDNFLLTSCTMFDCYRVVPR